MKRSRIVHLGSVVVWGLILVHSINLDGSGSSADRIRPTRDHDWSQRPDAFASGFRFQRLPSLPANSMAAGSAGPGVTREASALAAADFDEDGVLDLLVGYTLDVGGGLAVYRGNLRSIYSEHVSQEHTPAPFFLPTPMIEIPEPADFLLTGDFDADGHDDIAAAAAGSRVVYFLAGDGRGDFSLVREVDPSGPVTALMTSAGFSNDGFPEFLAVIGDREVRTTVAMTITEGVIGDTLKADTDTGASWDSASGEGSHQGSSICRLIKMRLNGDAIDDFAIIEKGNPVPLVALSIPAALFTVNSTGDGGDRNLSDGICDDGKGRCTLRAAIEQANASPEADWISFNIPSGSLPRISPTRALPKITQPVTLDGTSQPGGRVELSGVQAGIAVDGLSIMAGQTTVRGFILNRFDRHGILLEVGGGNIIEGNYIGTDASGMVGAGNTFDGVWMSSAGNTIGGTVPQARNLISGSGSHGVEVVGRDAVGNKILGNYIGTNAEGSAVISNGFHGIYINGAPGTHVGEAAPGARNLISGNWDGVRIVGRDAVRNVVEGNFIGTTASGSKRLGNSGTGILVNDAGNNLVGGLMSRSGNVISGNNAQGILMIGSRATGNTIQGNWIGTDATGSLPLTNGIGVFISDAPGNLVGGEISGAGNLLSGNGEGVRIAGTGASGNTVQGNIIGLNADGTQALGNSQDGIVIYDAPRNLIGGGSPLQRNVVSGNQARGVFVFGASSGTIVEGNFIGTTADGKEALSNAYHGIFISGAADTLIRGNLVSGNGMFGVLLYGPGARGTEVRENLIGTDLTGLEPVGNSVGVFVAESAGNNTIGSGNLIAFNQSDGVHVQSGTGNAISSNVMFGNGSMGINLAPGGHTPNDDYPGDEDADLGPNYLQNTPMINQCRRNGQTLSIDYMVSSATRNSRYPLTIEFFKSEPSGQGQVLLGADTFTEADRTAAHGKSVTFSLPRSMKDVDLIVATATDRAGNTSEFSPATVVR